MRTLAAMLLALVASTGVCAESVTLEGDAIAVFNLAGSIRAEAGGTDAVEAAVEFGGADAARLALELVTTEVRGRRVQALVVRYPDGDVVFDEGSGWGRTEVRVAGDGTFHQSRGRRVTISTRGRGTEAHADIVLRLPPGRSLSAYQAVGTIDVADVIADLYLDTHSGRIDVRRVDGEVVADTGSGGVTMEAIRGAGVVADTGSGGVELVDIDAKEVTADTGSGGVRMENVRAERVVADTGSGSVRMLGIDASALRIDTGSGGVVLGYVGAGGRGRIDTGSGSVQVTLPAGLGLDLEVDTGSGGINATLAGLTVRERDSDELLAERGDRALRLVIDTGSGGVRVSEE